FGKPDANKGIYMTYNNFFLDILITYSISIVIGLPQNMQSLEYHQFSLVHKRQIHITTLDLKNGLFCSSIAKVTLEKTQYRFQQSSQKRSLGQVKLSSTFQNKEFSIVEGKNTKFTKDVHEGENIVLS
ncbi:4968_t:CDS:1, partial [Cetraspora pellucida]